MEISFNSIKDVYKEIVTVFSFCICSYKQKYKVDEEHSIDSIELYPFYRMNA